MGEQIGVTAGLPSSVNAKYGTPTKFRKAIDQLFTYITWRDTKAALIIFIKTGSPTEILRKAREEVEKHANYAGEKTEVSETRCDYVLHSDIERRVDVALIGIVMTQE